MTGRAELEERRDQALRDLTELEVQVAGGEVDRATGASLRRRYEAAAAAALERLDAIEGNADDPGAGAAGSRALVGASVLAILAVLGAFVLVPRFTDLRPEGGFVTGNEAVGSSSGRDLSEVTNEEMEEVVAANPDIVAMRLRLAHRYLDDEDLRAAVRHYQEVLERERHPEALSHLGWVLFLEGEAELADGLLRASLERSPDEPEALWMHANVLTYGIGEPQQAVPILEALASRDDLGPTRGDVEAVLADARKAMEDVR